MRTPILLAFFAISWIVSGLILNVAQLILFILLRPLNRHLFRRINYYLTYSSWSQLVALAEYWAGFRVRVFFKDEESMKYMAQEHSLGISNHTYEVDWLFLWMIMDKFKFLANGKAFVKDSIKFLPVMGWSWFFNEFIFLKRNASKDLAIMGNCLNNFGEYINPIMMVLFAEGTRFTTTKHEASIKYASEHSMQPFKYHLNPRPKGFAFCVKHIKNSNNNNEQVPHGSNKCESSASNTAGTIRSIYNVQIAFNENTYSRSQLNMYSLINQVPLAGDVYMERIAIDSIDSSSDEKLSLFLNDLYREKDTLMDYHKANGKFPGVQFTQVSPRLAPVLNLAAWAVVIHSTILWTLVRALLMGNTVVAYSIIGTLAVLSICLLLLLRSTRSKHGSSYGVSAKGDERKQQ